MPSTGQHMCLSVRGALCWSEEEYKGALKWMKQDDGSPFASINKLRDALMDELSQGHEVVPMGKCDNFDWKKGCRGHPAKEEPEDA